MTETLPSRKPKADLLISRAAEILTCVPAGDDLTGRLTNGAIAIAGEQILAVGPAEQVAAQVDLSGARMIDATGRIVAPGFVDSHTHLVFGGSRAREYGLSMTLGRQEIEAMGLPTGILATVDMTRSTSAEQLAKSAEPRLRRMMSNGSTTVESKSGYGLSLEEELKILTVVQHLDSTQPVDLVSTFLGAHDFPREMSRKQYIELLTQEMIPQVADSGLASFCDVYCDDGYYDVQESRQILEAGLAVGLKAKIHTDAYSDIGGAAMAADLGVVSADHLNYTGKSDMRRLTEAGVIGVVMPALDFAVNHPRPFDGPALLDGGLTLALATDFCPACWVESMQFVMALACRLYRFTPEQALYAATAGGAQALALTDRGELAPGMLADLQIWAVEGLEDVIYRLGGNAVEAVIKRGQVHDFQSRPL